MRKSDLVKMAVKKAHQSQCRHKIGAIAFDCQGTLLGTAQNLPSQSPHGNRHHAEARLMLRYKNLVRTILIVRANQHGKLLPIDACSKCQKMADKLGVNIVSL